MNSDKCPRVKGEKMIKLLTDSGADLKPTYYERYDIDVMPLTVLLDDVVYHDQVNIQTKKLMDHIKQGALPKTSQVPVDIMEEKFLTLCQAYEHVVYITFSSGLSGTYHTATIVHDQLKDRGMCHNLSIIDSKCASLGQGLLVLECARFLKTSPSIDAVHLAINQYKEHVHHYFTISDLSHLYRGGRLSKSQAYLGSLMNIQPMMTIEDGKIAVVSKSRGEAKSIKKLIQYIKDHKPSKTIGINHSENMVGVHKLLAAFKKWA